MRNEAIEKYLVYNGKIIDVESSRSDSEFNTSIVYEVIRVIDGVPLFLEEHMNRLSKSSQMVNMNIKYISNSIALDVQKLIDINSKPEKNIKIIVKKNNNHGLDYSIFFIQSKYPQKELYDKGIHTILFKAVRENPNAKVLNSELRERVNKELSEADAYEALLLNEADEITEGSKSNVFFVKDNTLYTSPKKDVLLGVTRNRIVELAGNLGIDIVEEPVHKSFLKECDGLFITGTSPKVLPISSVNDIKYDSSGNKIILKVMKAYDSLIQDYIKMHG